MRHFVRCSVELNWSALYRALRGAEFLNSVARHPWRGKGLRPGHAIRLPTLATYGAKPGPGSSARGGNLSAVHWFAYNIYCGLVGVGYRKSSQANRPLTAVQFLLTGEAR